MTIFKSNQLVQIGRMFAERLALIDQPVQYHYRTDLAYCSREPCRSNALCLETGQPVRLAYDDTTRKFEVLAGQASRIGYLYADDAAFLAILYHYLSQQRGEPLTALLSDLSTVHAVITKPDPQKPATRRMRYPKVSIDIRMAIRHAWPLFTILAILNLKAEALPPCANLQENSWLQPLADLRRIYCRESYDAFRLPELLVTSWLDLTGNHDEEKL